MSEVAVSTIFSTSLSTALTPKTSVVESSITFHTTTAQVTVNAGSGRTQTDVNDLFGKVLTQTVVFQQTQVFTTVVPIQTIFSTVTSPTANAAAVTTATRTTTSSPAASPSSPTSTLASSPSTAAPSSTGAVAKEAALDGASDSSAAAQAGGSFSTTSTRTVNTLPSSFTHVAAITTFSASTTAISPNPSSSSTSNSAQTGGIVAAVLIVVVLLGGITVGGWWFRRRKKSREGGLDSGWMSQERSFSTLEDPDEKVAGRWMSGYGFGRASTLGATSWPEKSYFGKRRANSLAPHLPAPDPLEAPAYSIQPPLPDKNHNPFNDPLPPAKPVDAATALPTSTVVRTNSIPRKTVPPRHPFAAPGLPNATKSGNREYFGPGGRHPIFSQAAGAATAAAPGGASSNASLPSSNGSGSSVDDRHLSLTSTTRSSMSSNLQFHSSVTDSITIFHQIPSPTTSPTDTRPPAGLLRFDVGPSTPNPFDDHPPILRVPRPRIPSITLTMATGSMYSSTTTPSPGGGSERDKDEDPFASRYDSLALTEENETDSIRSSRSSSELPPLFTTAASLADDEERESLKSASSPTPPPFSNLFPSPLPSSSPPQPTHSSNPYHHHLPHQRPPPIQSSRLASSSKPNTTSSSFPSSPSTQPSTQPPPSPPFPYLSSSSSSPTPPATPATVHGIRTVLQNDQRTHSLYREALEKRKTIAESVLSNDSLDHLGSLLGHGQEGMRNEKWPRPPGEQ